MWSTGDGIIKPLQYFCFRDPWTLWKGKNIWHGRWPSRTVGVQYTTGEEWRNSSRKKEEAEPKQKRHPVVDVSGGFPGSSEGRVCLQCGRPGFSPRVRKIPWRRKWQPTPVLLPGKFQPPPAWRRLIGHSPWDYKESDTTEQLHWFTGGESKVL